jgi:hypothetical protein
LFAAITFFAIAMAYLESAVVVYLRHLYGIGELTDALSSMDPQIISIEVGRELATLVMLAAVGWMAGRDLQTRVGSFIMVFGIWDIFYYFWLRIFIGWPAGWFDTDLLFMIPLPWWGPVLAPMLLALLMTAAGRVLVHQGQRDRIVRFSVWEWVLLAGGILVDLYAFMADALAVLPASADTLSQVQMGQFDWPVFLLGWVMIGSAFVRTIIDRRFPVNEKTESA